jgi:hypothetical protein
MVVILFLLVLLAIAGLLGAVLKVVFVIVTSVTLAVLILGWLAWRGIRRQLEEADRRLAVTQDPSGTTRIQIGKVERTPPDEPPAIDERY